MSTPITIPVNFDFGPGFSSAPRAAAELQRIFNQGNNFNRISQPLGQMSRSADEFANSLKAANARVLAFGASAAVIITVQRALEGLVSSTINVEKRLTDINVVLNESRAGLQKFGAELFVTARQTGQSFDAVSDAALELSRQGLSVQETLKRTRDALVLTRLSGLDAKDSVEALTAGINSFNRTLVTSTELVNKFAAVDARFAVSSADLAEALKRVGSTAQDAGVGLEELLGLVTAVQQTTARGGAVIGNAFKNIFSRLSRSTTIEDLRALGVQIDASQTGVEKLQALADAYKRVGVEQANQIKEAAGGVYQINVVAAALDQLSRKYGTYQQALAAANSATDEATLRNEALNQTLSALINRTQVNFTKLFSDIGSLSIDSPLRSLLGDFNSILESVSDGETTGGKLAESFLKGIGKFIEGPGALYLGTIALVLSKRLAGFAGDAFKQLNSIKFGDTERRLNLEKSIQSIIGNNPRIQDQIVNGSLRIEDIQSRILADLRQEVVVRERIAALAQRIAPTALSSGIVINPKTNLPERRTRASGLIPTPEESMAETMGAYAAGYTPGNVKAANIKGLGRIVYNDAEKVVDIGLSQPAIIPPRNSQVSGVYRNKFQQRFGVDPYALANGYVPNFKNENNFRMRKGAFGDYEFENRFGGGVVDIFDDEAEIGAIDTKEQGKGTYKFLLSDLMSNLKQKGIKKVKGFLIPQNNKPKTDALTDQIKAAYPQLIRGRYGKSSILTIDGRAIRLAGGDAFDASLAKQANTILSSIRNGGDVDFETFLNKGLIPNFLPTGILRPYRQVLKKLQNKDYNTYELNPKSSDAMVRSAAGFFRTSDMSLNFAKGYENNAFVRAHEGTHNILALLNDDLNYSRSVPNVPGKFPLRIALAMSGGALISKLEQNAKKGFPVPSTLKRLLANPDLYPNVGFSFLEESIADNALNNQQERSLYANNLGLSSRQADTASKLFERLRKTGIEVSDQASGDFYFKSNGNIPNFNALTSAITREAAAVNPSQIRIGQDTRLVNSKNPAGIGVYNTKDEPGGLGQGIARAYAEGLNPKTYNVPNYAPKKVISGGVDPLIVSGTSGGQKFEIIVKIPTLDRAAASFDNMVREQKIDRTVKERNDARSIARQAKIQEEERFLFNTPFRRERRLNSERNLLAQQSAFAASAPNITVPNPFGAISVPSLPGAPLATQPQTLQDRININNAVRQAQENINRRNEDAAARDRRRLDQASNSINPPQIGRIYVPNVNESRNINGGAQYVNNQGRVDDPFIRNKSTAPPIIGANGRIFIPGVSDLQQRQEQALRDIENQNAIRAAREAELRNRGSSIFRGRSRRAQASLLSEGLVTRDDLIGIENLRQNKLQNFGFGLSLAAPIVSQFATDALQNGRQSGRIAGAAASGLGNAFSFGATAFTATGGNPAATAIGVVIGALTGLVGVAKEAGNTIPELTDRIEKLQGQTNETARAASEYFSVSEKIKQITLGQTSATKGQLNELQNTQTAAFLSLPQEIREIVKTSVANDDVEGAYRAIDRVQVLVTQQANLLQEIVKIQTANKDLRFNQNANRNGSGFLGISGRNLSEFTKFSIDNPLLGGVALGGLRGGATDARKALRILSNNSFGDLALGAVDSLGLDITNQGLPQNKTQLADEVFNGSVLTTSEQKDLLRERRQFNRSNRSVVNQLIGFTNESGSNFAEVASQDPAFQEALATKNTSQIIKQAKEVAKKNNFNFLAISEFLTDYVESVPEEQYKLLGVAAQSLNKKQFDEAKALNAQIRFDDNKRFNEKFDIDRNFGNYFDNLSEIGRRQSVTFDNSAASLSLQNRIGAISAEGFFDRQNLLGGERTSIINRGALSQRVAGNQFQENLLGANQSFASNSFRDIAQTLKEATDKISINAQGSNGTAEQRQNRLNAVRSLFTEQLGLNPETLNADKLTPQTVTALIAKVRDSERTLLTARDNNQTISANGISLTNQDINSILNEYSQLTKKLNDNLKDLSDTSNKANQAYKGNITEILKETFERIRTKNAQEALTLSLEKAAFTFGNETSLRNARFETGQTARNANNTISNLGLVGFDRIRAEGAFSLDQIQTRARFGLGQSERSLIGQALGQKDALSNDLSASGISDLAGVNQRISALSLNTDPASVDILNKYKSLQQQIIAQQNEINSLLPEQLAQERELIKLKEQELRFSTAFSDEQARLNLSGVEGRIRTGQGIGFGDFRQTVGDQFNYTAKDFQRDAITGTAEVAGTIKSSFASATADVIKNGKNIKEALTGVLTGVLDKIIDKTTEISTGFLFSGLKAVAGFSAGGPVLDGSGVRDDVPALLTKGEFVIKKDAVQKIGLQNLQKLNSGVNINLRNEFSYDDERRPTRGQQNIDPNLSVIGLTDTEISGTNQLKFSREQELASYLNDYRNYEQSKRDALKAYADQKRNRLYGSYISAGIGVAGAGFSSYFQGVGARGNTNAGVRGGVDYNYRSNPYSSGIANVASGGVMFGGTSSSDVVPARLTRGEFVMNKSTVDRVGVNVFKSINNGYEAGGLVRSPVVTPQKSTLAMAQPASQNTNISNQSTNNISINVNITSDGKVSSSVNEDNKKKSEQGKALGELISSKVRETMVKESAQGGLLYNMVRANK
jgi:TP901 family phage tail tape measure protein